MSSSSDNMKSVPANDMQGATSRTPHHASAAQPAKTPNKRSRLAQATAVMCVAALTIAVAVAGLWKVGWFKSGIETTDDAYVDGHVVSVAPQVAGRIMDVLVDDNQRIEEGQILLKIDPADYQVKLDLALAAKAQAEGQLKQAMAQLPVQQAAAAQAQSQVKVAQANADKAADDLARYRQLSEDAISKITVRAAETQQTATAAQVEAARQSASAAAAQVELARTAIGTAQANLKAAAAQVAQAELNLSYCEVKAAMAGYITRKTVEKGNYVPVGQPMMHIVPQNVYVTANFKETQLKHMQPGQPVTFTADAYPGKVFRGHVESMMSGTGSAFALLPPENATGNFVKVVQRVPVKILLDDANDDITHRLVPGMSVVPEIDYAAKRTSSAAAYAQVRSR